MLLIQKEKKVQKRVGVKLHPLKNEDLRIAITAAAKVVLKNAEGLISQLLIKEV